MAVKMRLMRMGKKKQPVYRVVVVDGRSPRDGRYIEQIGRYDPLQEPSLVEIDNEKATAWLSKGAQPTEAVEKLLNISGAMATMKVRTGQIHTVGTLDDVEAVAPDVEAVAAPEVEAVAPDVEAVAAPEVVAVAPDVEAVAPDVEAAAATEEE
jgi:small subunit ribosomal protein S16